MLEKMFEKDEAELRKLAESIYETYVNPIIPPESLPERVSEKQIAEAPKEKIVEEEPKNCVICMDQLKQGAFVPCGHMCCCETCGKEMANKNCPICRAKVTSFLKIFNA